MKSAVFSDLLYLYNEENYYLCGRLFTLTLNIMKKLFILLTCSCIALGGFAQDDDVYFVPQKSKKTNRAEYIPVQQNDDAYSYTNEMKYDNWADGNAYSEEDIDAYNRRYQNDTTNIDTMNVYNPEVYAQDEYTQGTYTARLVRFHSPRAGIIVSSPYYVDYYDLWGSPWYYDTWYGYPYWYGHNWYYSSWYWGWGYNCWDWYWGWGCPNYWWGHHHHYYPHYPHYPHYPNHPHYASGNRGPHGGWVDRYRTNSGNKYASNNRTNNARNTRGYDSNYRPSREFGNRGNNSSRRDVNKTNNNRYQNSGTTTRQFGNSNRTTTTTRTTTRSYDNTNSNRSYNSNSTNRSYNSTSSYSRSYSTGAGSSRSFGGGGGARGGRR